MTGILAQCRVREAVPGDALALSKLAFHSKAHWGYDIEFMKRCRAELSYSADQIAAPEFLFRVCEFENAPIAFYALELRGPSEAELEALFVQPEFMRHGIGGMLIAHALGEASSLGVAVIKIQGDPNADEFYRSVGAKPAGYRESASIPGRYLPVYRLAIAQEQTQ